MADLREKSGFSLIELLIALSVLMIGIVGIIGVQVAGIHQLAQAKQRTIATQLATQVMEYLKNTPVDTSVNPDPSKVFEDVNGVRQVDAQGFALLNDTGIGDGLLTWHVLPLMRADGTPLDDVGNWKSDYFYLIAYGVEWGGANGSTCLSGINKNGNEAYLAQFPDPVPGINEIYIEVWVGWVEPGRRFEVHKNVLGYYNAITQTSPPFPTVFPSRKVKIKVVRRVEL